MGALWVNPTHKIMIQLMIYLSIDLICQSEQYHFQSVKYDKSKLSNTQPSDPHHLD